MQTNRTHHRMRRNEAFDASCLYMNEDTGEVQCGQHVGTEATYRAHQYFCFGPVESYTSPDAPDVTFVCETPHRRTA